MTSARFRDAVRDNLAVIVFLSAYFFLTVLGNMIYLVPGGDIIGRIAIKNFSIKDFQTAGNAGFLLLLFLPFVFVPIAALVTRHYFGGLISYSTGLIREFSRLDFAAITSTIFAYVIYSFWRVDAVGLLRRGSDVYGAVRSRFELLEELGYWPQMALKSLLIFLACYAFVRAIRTREIFWITAALATFLLMTLLLILLNMKWPLLIFYVALAFSAFSFAPKRPYIGAFVVLILIFTTYALISAVLLRIVPPPPPELSRAHTGTGVTIELPFEFLGRAASAALENTTLLGFTLINRMAQPYPYYFDIFTKDGQVCGTLVDRIKRRSNPCQPSNLVYNKMFSDAMFGEAVAGKGTSPQPVHVHGYALDGWTGAIVELIFASIILGLFISVPATQSYTAATVTIMGGLTGYFFSQLPVEGPIIYDHGVAWWGLLIASYSIVRFLSAKQLIDKAVK